MAEVIEVSGRQELVDHLRKVFMSEVNESGSNVTVKNYGGIDERIGWDTHMVLVDGKPYGFTNGPVSDIRESANEPA
jgi:hypothetical protein